MSEPQSRDEFEHFYRSGFKNLELEIGDLALKQATGGLRLIDQELIATLQKIVSTLDPKKPLRPEEVFSAALSSTLSI